MFQKNPFLTLTLAALSLPSAALALNYTGTQKNQATFETLEEARVSGPVAVATIDGNTGRTFKSHPALDGYPEGDGIHLPVGQHVRRSRRGPDEYRHPGVRGEGVREQGRRAAIPEGSGR